MGKTIEAETAKLAGLQIDQNQKLRNGQITLEQMEWWLTQTKETRERLVRGTHELKFVKHLIDCDADPYIPEGWKKEEHHKGGQLEWNPAKIQLYLSEKQKGRYIKGYKLRKELAEKPVLNANVLDYLLAHSELIPEEWKGKFIFFWGTIYRDSDGGLVVRCLSWDGGEWSWRYYWLDYGWHVDSPAVLFAS